MKQLTRYRVGLDVGSTTAKIIIIGADDKVVFSKYVRYHIKINETAIALFREAQSIIGNEVFNIAITGSAGYELCEKLSIPFVQEVIATSVLVKHKYSEVKTLIDIGG